MSNLEKYSFIMKMLCVYRGIITSITVVGIHIAIN